MENKMNHMQLKDLFVESIKDNKKLIIGLYVLFIAVFIASWILASPQMQSVAGDITPLNNPQNTGVGPLELFIQNAGGGIMTYLASVFFAIPAIVMVIYNAVNISLIGPLFDTILPNGGIMFILYLIPHGIFEITATILQSTAGILLFKFIWKFIKAWRSSDTDGAGDAYEKTKKILLQSLALMVIATVLLIIAAPIEAYVSLPVSQFLMGVLGLS
ncbi:MAG: stage II sporulation protein M [Methanobrevibacter sp.]|uniref:stage II sporulation protein M n=1 Tax=Methanobrevibacter sp. TaxID=66852 RepID=UPI0025CBB7D5|nr:stage II sporulation protein M [Methanobrevibacter sp.]MBR3113302.1 stage II sporulation protein M [Methanobrevibacter sp.]